MHRKIFSIIIGISFISVAPFAATSQMMTREVDTAERLIGKIELAINSIESKMLITDSVIDELEQHLSGYKENIHAAYSDAINDPEKKEKFMDVLRSHKKKFEGFQKKMVSIEGKVKKASIILDRPVLQKMSSSELRDFKKFLSPEGLQKMEEEYPDIFGIKRSLSFGLISFGDVSILNSLGINLSLLSEKSSRNTNSSVMTDGGCWEGFYSCMTYCDSRPRWLRPGCRIVCSLALIGCWIVTAP